jgi:hypothetical protein
MDDKKSELPIGATEIFKAIRGREPDPGEMERMFVTGKAVEECLAISAPRMKLSDFNIGESFWNETGEWRCTDIGSRVVVAIKLGPREIVRMDRVDGELRETRYMDDDPSWLNGPPYAVAEIVFDEYDFETCYPTEAEMRADFPDE